MEKLTIHEEEVMQSIWQIDGGFIRDIREQLKNGDDMPYTTVASVVRNLERKGYVKATPYANAKKYDPVISLEEYKAKFMNGFIGDYFRNSYKDMVSFFVKEEKLSSAELEEILKMIKDNKSK